MTTLLALLVVLMAAGDCWTTHRALQLGGREVNPFFGPRPSARLVVVAHVAAIALLFCAAYLDPRHRLVLLLIGVLAYGAAVLWNLYQLRKVSR